MGDECETGEEGLVIDEIFDVVHKSCYMVYLSSAVEERLREVFWRNGQKAVIHDILEILEGVDEADAERARVALIEKGLLPHDDD